MCFTCLSGDLPIMVAVTRLFWCVCGCASLMFVCFFSLNMSSLIAGYFALGFDCAVLCVLGARSLMERNLWSGRCLCEYM